LSEGLARSFGETAPCGQRETLQLVRAPGRRLTSRFWRARATVASSLVCCVKSLDGSEARHFKFGASSPERKINEPA
jgi:hypothetical protein